MNTLQNTGHTFPPVNTQALLQQASSLHVQGDLEQAEALYHQVLSIEPNNADALHLLGFLAHQLEFHEEAIELIKKAIKASPKHALFHNNLAKVYAAAGKPEKAEKSYRNSLKINNSDPDVMNDLGNLLVQLKKPKKAEQLIRKAIKLKPEEAIFYNNLGTALRDQFKADEADEAYRRAIEINPEFAGAMTNLGIVLSSRNKLDEAIALFEHALEIDPNNAHAHNNMADVFVKQRKMSNAVRHYIEASETDPNNARIFENLGRTLMRMKLYSEAIIELSRAMELDSTNSATFVNFGKVLRYLGKFDQSREFLEASLEDRPDDMDLKDNLSMVYLAGHQYDKSIAMLDEILALHPDDGGAVSNLGFVLHMKGMIEEAFKLFKKAIKLKQDDPQVQFNFASALLSNGELEQGWKYYRGRKGLIVHESVIREFPHEEWAGQPLRGKKIFLWDEQGIGDELRFASMFPDIINMGAEVTIECQSRLADLFARSFPAAEIQVSPYGPAETGKRYFDYHCSALDLAPLVRATIESFPKGDDSYLVPDAKRVAFWKNRIAQLPEQCNIGLVWRSGHMVQEKKYFFTNMDGLAPILALPGVNFINLMYSECAADVAEAKNKYGVTLHTWDDINMLNDLDDISALMSNLDLVISQTSAVSEMAGGLGVPCFGFYPLKKDVFMLGTGNDAWHNTARFFLKDDIFAPWEPIFADMAMEIRKKFGLDA